MKRRPLHAWSLLALGLALATTATVAAAQSPAPGATLMEQRMTPEEFKAAGLEKLSAQELAAAFPQAPTSAGPTPALDFTPENPVIASKPSDIRKLFREIHDIAAQIKAIDFKGIADQAKNAFNSLDKAVAQARIGDISADIRTLLASVNAAASPERLQSLARNVDGSMEASRRLMDKAAEELTRMDAVLAQFQAMLDANRPHVDTTMGALAGAALKTDAFMAQSQATMLQMQATIRDLEDRLSATAENLEQTSGNLNALITSVKDQPAQLLFGEPKAPRITEE